MMRHRMAALAATGILFLTAAAPAYAAGPYSCTATATLTEDGTQIYSATDTYTSPYDLSTSYTKTFTYNGGTYTYTLVVKCTR
jgi:hypothetical protein